MLQYKIPKSKTILHSIPIGSIMILLLLLSFLITPNIYYSNSSAYATEEDNVSSSANNNASARTNNTDSSTSLIIGGAEMNEVVDASVGEVAYRKHTVTISASKLKSYTLFISGPEGLNGETAITGANGNTPVDMPKNSWGYAYGQDGNENDMTYNSFTNNAELIDSKLESESSAEDTDFTKNLIFAVKFGNAISGHYTGTVTLSLAAEPKEVVLPTNPVETWDELKSMQQMTSKACASIGTAGSGNYPSKTLVDSRDGNEYTITKLDDQNCWMTTNLRLVSPSEDKKITLTSADSNVSSDYDVPASSSPWQTSSSSGNAIPTLNKVHYKGNTTNGANYTWYTATASTQGSSYSICPRGWRLPSNTEYNTLLSSAGITNGGKLNGSPYNFSYAGYVYSGSLRNVGSEGRYWSSTADGADSAYYLYFDSSYVYTNNYLRYYGYSVRCVAMNAEDEKEQEEAIKNTPVDNWADVEYMQQMSPQACESASTAGDDNYPSKILKDSRDNNTYTVTKLDDQKCWMTQNLRITGDSIKAKDPSNTTGTITSADSNVSSNYNIPASSSPWKDTDYNVNKVYFSNNIAKGSYYPWFTATAGTSSSNASICPKGWKLPTVAEYEAFLNAAHISYRKNCNSYGCEGSSDATDSTKIRSAPYDFQYVGLVDNGAVIQPNIGGYWTSEIAASVGSYPYAHMLYIQQANVNISENRQYRGYSVRCIAQ